MSLKNGFIGSPRTFVRTSDWLTDSVCGMSGPDDLDSRIHDPEKSGWSCAATPAPTDTITTTKHIAVRRILSLFMTVSSAGVISLLVQRSNVSVHQGPLGIATA